MKGTLKNKKVKESVEFSLMELNICTGVLEKIVAVIKDGNAITAGILEMAISSVNLIKEMPSSKEEKDNKYSRPNL